MLIGLQTGFTEHSIAHLLPVLKQKGFTLIRIDGQHLSPDVLYARAKEVLDGGLRVLVIVRTASQIKALPPGCDVCLGNEPDIAANRWTVGDYTDQIFDATTEAEQVKARLWVGEVSNLNTRGLAFLSALPWPKISRHVGASFHRYPTGNGFDAAHRPAANRAQEVTMMRRIVGPRAFGISEVGYHTAPRPFAWLWSRRWTNAQVARFMARERAFWSNAGAAFCCAYQVNDGPDDTAEHRYGFRDLSGAWKPVTSTFTGRV